MYFNETEYRKVEPWGQAYWEGSDGKWYPVPGNEGADDIYYLCEVVSALEETPLWRGIRFVVEDDNCDEVYETDVRQNSNASEEPSLSGEWVLEWRGEGQKWFPLPNHIDRRHSMYYWLNLLYQLWAEDNLRVWDTVVFRLRRPGTVEIIKINDGIDELVEWFEVDLDERWAGEEEPAGEVVSVA